MATNKHATIRYQTLDKCFRNPGKRYFIEDLMDSCNEAIYDYTGIKEGVKKRQLFEDIKFMESGQGWSVPLEKYKDGKRVFYRYSDLKFSINNHPINETEAVQLRETLMLLSRFKGMPRFEWVEELIARMESTFILTEATNKIIDFEQNQYLKGLEFFSDVFNGILYKKPLKIHYKSFSQKTGIDFNLHPYFLKQYNSRWFLFGLNDGRKDITTIALDRIIKVSPLNIRFTENSFTNFDEYFEDVIGVTVPEKSVPEIVKIRIGSSLWPYIETKPLHGSQRVINKDGDFTIVELCVIINYELIALLFSFGEEIRIMEPKTLSDALISKASKLLKNYS